MKENTPPLKIFQQLSTTFFKCFFFFNISKEKTGIFKSQKKEIFTMMCRTYLATPRYTPTLQVPDLHSYTLRTFGGWVHGSKAWAVVLWLHYDFGGHMNRLESGHIADTDSWSYVIVKCSCCCCCMSSGVSDSQPSARKWYWHHMTVFTTELMPVSAKYST